MQLTQLIFHIIGTLQIFIFLFHKFSNSALMHPECLTCSQCQTPLTDTCFARYLSLLEQKYFRHQYRWVGWSVVVDNFQKCFSTQINWVKIEVFKKKFSLFQIRKFLLSDPFSSTDSSQVWRLQPTFSVFWIICIWIFWTDNSKVWGQPILQTFWSSLL